MTTFVDTSALFALLDEDDDNHQRAAEWLGGPGSSPAEILVTHSYVVVETAALTFRRLGPVAVKVLFDGFIPALSVFYVDETLHRSAVASHLAALPRDLSLVDWVSFLMMRERGIESAFAFDSDFTDQGFRLVP